MCAGEIKDGPRTTLQPLKKGQNKVLLISCPSFLCSNACDLTSLEYKIKEPRVAAWYCHFIMDKMITSGGFKKIISSCQNFLGSEWKGLR